MTSRIAGTTIGVSLVVALVLLLAGCGTSPVPEPTFGFGDDAVSIARAVPACRAASEQPVPSTLPGAASIATCLVTGSQVDFVVWKDAASQKNDGPLASANDAGEAYVAHGDGWDATVHAADRLGQQRIVATAVVDAAGGRVVHISG